MGDAGHMMHSDSDINVHPGSSMALSCKISHHAYCMRYIAIK